ncbi:MAG: ABC transporter ATP-binding protein [Mycoplasma sp.]|nr:ABC transporter ATP-binding protein [Mycoplasma sp.]
MSLIIKNVTKVFENKKVALDKVNLEFKKNQITGLIGFNGSGKTTLYNIILNFIEKHEGEILLNNKPITKKDLRFFTFLGAGMDSKNTTTSRNYLLMISDLYFVPKEKAQKTIEKLAKKMDFIENLDKPIKTLSKGNQQKIKVIISLLNPNTKYLILDEPFDGLDPLMVDTIAKLYLKLKNVTIIVTSHRMEVVQQMCNDFYVIKDGKIIDMRKINKESIMVAVNSEVSIKKIQQEKYVTSINKINDEHLIEIKDISSYKKLTSLLIADKNYTYSTISQKSIAESVFLGYGDKNE